MEKERSRDQTLRMHADVTSCWGSAGERTAGHSQKKTVVLVLMSTNPLESGKNYPGLWNLRNVCCASPYRCVRIGSQVVPLASSHTHRPHIPCSTYSPPPWRPVVVDWACPVGGNPCSPTSWWWPSNQTAIGHCTWGKSERKQMIIQGTYLGPAN